MTLIADPLTPNLYMAPIVKGPNEFSRRASADFLVPVLRRCATDSIRCSARLHQTSIEGQAVGSQ